MSINPDLQALGKDAQSLAKDLAGETQAAGDAALDRTKTAIGAATTPFYTVIGASDHAAKLARALVTDLRTRTETLPADLKNRAHELPSDVLGATGQARNRATAQAAAVRPEVLLDAVRAAVTDAVEAARKALARYEKRGQMVVADLRRAPAFTRVLKRAESAVDQVEDALEELIKDAQGELRGARKSAGSTATKAKATARKAGSRRTGTTSAANKSAPSERTTKTATGAKRGSAKTGASGASKVSTATASKSTRPRKSSGVDKPSTRKSPRPNTSAATRAASTDKATSLGKSASTKATSSK